MARTPPTTHRTVRTPPASEDAGRAPMRRSAEFLIAALLACLLNALMLFPLTSRPWETIPADLGDPLLTAAILAWPAEALNVGAPGIWDFNTFYPQEDTLAYSDALLGYAPAALVGKGPAAAALRYNVLYWFAGVCATLGMYLLARQLGANWAGAAVAACGFAFAPWRWAQAGHLNILSTGGIPLSLALLARGSGWTLVDRWNVHRIRLGWILVGWLTATWQMSLGFNLGLPFVYILLAACIATAIILAFHEVRQRRPHPKSLRRFLTVHLTGGAIFAVTLILLATPYFRVAERFPQARRTLETIERYSPPPRGLVTAPETSWLFGQWDAAYRESELSVERPEKTLSVGRFVLALAVLGLAVSRFPPRQRLALAALATLAAALATGTSWIGASLYEFLHGTLPGWAGIRTPGRLVVWLSLALCLLASGAVTYLSRRSRERWGRTVAVAIALVPTLLVLAEGRNLVYHPVVPKPPVAFGELDDPVLVLPMDGLTDTRYVLWSTNGFPRLINGSSGFFPPTYREFQRRTEAFPDPESVAFLRARGVRTVLVVTALLPGSAWEELPTRPVDEGIERLSVPGALVFRL